MPAPGEFLEGGNIEIAVMEPCLEPGHAACQKAAILAYGIAAHRRDALGHPLPEESHHRRLGFGLVDGGGAHTFYQAGAAMGVLVPLIHPPEHGVGLVYRDHRRLGDNVERAVGDDEADLDDAVAPGIEAGHFEVEPNQVIRVLCHNLQTLSFMPDNAAATTRQPKTAIVAQNSENIK